MSFTIEKNIIGKILLLLVLLQPLSLLAQEKRALVIGLGEQEDKSWGKINGDKDVTLVNEILTNAGYSDIITLINKQATKRNIITSFNTLLSRCNNGDKVYIHFSGHGQQMDDFNNDESDNLDECWIPYDAYMTCCERDNGSRHLTDDEINNILHRISNKIGKKGSLLVVVDACHSGDSSRGNDDIAYRGTMDRFYAEEDTNIYSGDTDKEEWIIVSACRDYQRNAELKTSKGQYGKLTYALYKMLKQKNNKTNLELYKDLCNFFDKHRGVLQQTPVIKGVMTEFNITDMF